MNKSNLTPGKLFNLIFSLGIGQLVAEEFCAGQPLWPQVPAAALGAERGVHAALPSERRTASAPAGMRHAEAA